MPGYKVFLQDGGDIREGLTCSYCKLVLKDPVQTSESGQRLCRECFDKATKLVTHKSVISKYRFVSGRRDIQIDHIYISSFAFYVEAKLKLHIINQLRLVLFVSSTLLTFKEV